VVLAQMLGLARENGSSVVIVTHDQAIADQAGRRLELRAGRLWEDAPVAAVAQGASP
jgi:predicted ABC-type transport system involved in lysophospholipase L1 biosynthesis ATPase subunit